MTKFIYAAGSRNFHGEGYFYHKYFKFPDFPYITKTITYNRKNGHPFAVIPIPFFKSIWNKVSLHNYGVEYWLSCTTEEEYSSYFKDNFISIYPYDDIDACILLYKLIHDQHIYSNNKINNNSKLNIEINLSCPNTDKEFRYPDIQIPDNKNVNIWLKLNALQNPEYFDLTNVKGIRLNSLPFMFGGLSGKIIQKRNWDYIEKYFHLCPISGCSWTSLKDLLYLTDTLKCKEISIGSVILTNPKLVEKLNYIK